MKQHLQQSPESRRVKKEASESVSKLQSHQHLLHQGAKQGSSSSIAMLKNTPLSNFTPSTLPKTSNNNVSMRLNTSFTLSQSNAGGKPYQGQSVLNSKPTAHKLAELLRTPSQASLYKKMLVS
mmetsp:Transcript_12368/g.19231  ORF Transcript_12368/g.19231 Transcript_12368/m.19231 type:complete len:123 (+) Transcript_12368:1542-1910(+)